MNYDQYSSKNSDAEISSLPLYTIGIASKLAGTSVHTLRMYENKGLILPHKTKTKRRVYSKTDIERILCIRRHIVEDGLNIAGIKTILAMVPCWEFKPCSKASRESCDAYTSTSEPCWAASQKGKECQNIDCRTCDVYLLANKCSDIKALYKELMNKKD
ncbi:MAG: MerR family transcriptional regulator [Candidatus Marinimicrobia bacterium]|jgi:MerR family transcriptional regulator/heat shock protein HspR|nr:MerR family transcriptional regulator [Candidatus Neomarinimicrobiota bacterium]MBT3495951.1 MerR family transcriptional regulator [Candidatus Neomarinimicrobiota bacterium]MBT3692119.1 MerR family transcriptional regulator [Candidatus Neomarinimicrobiota bacterium]MBT3732120.1 MerR family transcriptional regulator [Candidatus Neomarinimicrobiota bacterium]MBT4143813.1 MerR family transcriptional regulator [Candidatus Neomarinimicrobiota bacterium]